MIVFLKLHNNPRQKSFAIVKMLRIAYISNNEAIIFNYMLFECLQKHEVPNATIHNTQIKSGAIIPKADRTKKNYQGRGKLVLSFQCKFSCSCKNVIWKVSCMTFSPELFCRKTPQIPRSSCFTCPQQWWKLKAIGINSEGQIARPHLPTHSFQCAELN